MPVIRDAQSRRKLTSAIRDHVNALENQSTTAESRKFKDAFVLETAQHASIWTPGKRPALELGHNIAFVLNVSRLIANTRAGLALAPRNVIRRANRQEIKAAKDICKDYGLTYWTPWECDRSEDGKYRSLPENQ